MRKQMIILTIILFCLAFLHLSAAEETAWSGIVGKVTTPRGSLNMRTEADGKSSILQEIPNGTCLLVTELGDIWCRCEWQGHSGYCRSEFLTMLQYADPSLLDYRVLRQGDKGDDVLALKQRLQELGYIRAGSILTNRYNDILAERVSLFQRQVCMTEDGIASQELQFYLFSDRAPQYTQALPRIRSRVQKEDNGLNRVICGCCMGEGCECCGYSGQISY